MIHTTAPKEVPPPLSRNTISFFGWIVSICMFIVLALLIAVDFIYHHESPYTAMLIYMVLPGFLAGGIGLIFLGMFLEWRRRHKKEPGVYPRLPVIDINQPWQRWRIFIGMALASLFVAISTIGSYQAYHFTESPMFCGMVCHKVMKPEYVAYQHSSHARVSCAECHIGSGAEWYVKAKFSGLRQVWAVATQSYHLPIKTPVANLRPARETCEECHWPEKFSDSLERTIWHFSPDQSNTPTRYNLLLKVGGGIPGAGPGHGIHWHMSRDITVRYWARDNARMDIPYVEVAEKGKDPRVYKAADCPDPLPAGAELRTMDCMDCHNRPAHVYRSPHQLADYFLSNGVLDATLPYLKRYAVELMEKPYPDTETALATIAGELQKRYQGQALGERGQQKVNDNVKWLQTLYQRNFFPEQGVDWRQYPNHIGHYEFPGCYRCHDEKHTSKDGHKISNDCNLCHEMLDQGEGEAAYKPSVSRGQPFRHPRGLTEIWKGKNCTDCHGLVTAKPAKDEKVHAAKGH